MVLSACVTPDQRIKSHEQLFAQATPEQQALIRQGQIALGFTPDFVKLALGPPDRVTEKTDANGTETFWHYIEDDYGYGYVGGGFGYGRGPFWAGPAYGIWGPPPIIAVPATGADPDRFRIRFHDGKVDSIERVVRS
jgi:hypothetical protein